jgi:hypothetical protein
MVTPGARPYRYCADVFTPPFCTPLMLRKAGIGVVAARHRVILQGIGRGITFAHSLDGMDSRAGFLLALKRQRLSVVCRPILHVHLWIGAANYQAGILMMILATGQLSAAAWSRRDGAQTG